MYIEVDELVAAIGFQAAAMAAGKEEGEFEDECEAVIEAVTAVIDAMISGRVDPALVEDNALLKRVCLQISKYDLFNQYARDEVPESVRKDKEEAMKMLAQIQEGKIDLVVEKPGAVESYFDSATRQLGEYL